ncbi:5-deoxy-glucuronate isomerase [Sporosarcina sp. Marseille-Q4063]|uniref:5-deoxy-glucuronate isomerase n=1 Tax=Sporosarcina sp. Marseille-Q4063 TaxID=2810514 RepID=UPI001BAF4F1E|nr:5-deoxy-glucuronate isomerase [Sporosarcina sp. Marseille-Q4063]QUW21503.1 5-deoxy-glucuronate isomerase [Sporosarcina sp. Marseille-Q4063]
MSRLLIKPEKPDQEGKVLSISPQSAGWQYVGFEVYSLKKGETIQKNTEDYEVCLVLLTGRIDIKTNEEEFMNIGNRMSVFEKVPPYSVYIPNDDSYLVTALTNINIAICYAPGKGSFPTRLIAPEMVGIENRGSGKMSRKIHNILPEEEAADSLLVVEVFTPEGNTSSYPPHKHDKDNLPHESYLEETYYHEINPEQGFVFQRVYNDDRSLDETMSVENKNVVMVPEGYHPVSSVPGYESYYLNVMAGPVRTWVFHNDPKHEWLFETGK